MIFFKVSLSHVRATVGDRSPTSKQGDQHTLVGVISWGEGVGATCGDSSVFARVSHVRQWIDDHMKNTQFCKFAGNSDQPVNK